MSKYKSMDRTSAGVAKALDERRKKAAEAKKRKADAWRRSKDRGSLSRGGFTF